jgi:predicted Fe-S protein YdhL (DUF1289 family)
MNVCVLDEHDCCTGCRRTAGEIARWSRMSAAEQWGVVERIERRRAVEKGHATVAIGAAEG